MKKRRKELMVHSLRLDLSVRAFEHLEFAVLMTDQPIYQTRSTA